MELQSQTTDVTSGREAGRGALLQRRRWLKPLTGFGVVVMAMGLLLWARFLLVSGHPRTAIAEPKQVLTPSFNHASGLPDKARAPATSSSAPAGAASESVAGVEASEPSLHR